jgi:hypothetical protein
LIAVLISKNRRLALRVGCWSNFIHLPEKKIEYLVQLSGITLYVLIHFFELPPIVLKIREIYKKK